jgi:hypothetical protein
LYERIAAPSWSICRTSYRDASLRGSIPLPSLASSGFVSRGSELNFAPSTRQRVARRGDPLAPGTRTVSTELETGVHEAMTCTVVGPSLAGRGTSRSWTRPSWRARTG